MAHFRFQKELPVRNFWCTPWEFSGYSVFQSTLWVSNSQSVF